MESNKIYINITSHIIPETHIWMAYYMKPEIISHL